MKNRPYKKVVITTKGERSLKLGHPWVYEGEVIQASDIANGELVDVTDLKDKYLGTGFYNAHSKIRVRVLSQNPNDLYDEAFFKRRLRYAWDYRKAVMPDLDAVRVIYGEADGLPGLTVDKFHDILVAQVLSLGIDQRKDIIFKALLEIMAADGIKIRGLYERNDVGIRELEGLSEGCGWYTNPHPDETKVIITENDIKYIVDFENGQKTGYFLDQKLNRLVVRDLAKKHKVLDCCTHTGSFAMNAYLGGATKVVAMDISAKALEDAQANFKLNGMKIETEQADVFDYLSTLKNNDFDFIILDPPAFTKSRQALASALKGYTELNYLAMKALPRGGFLATASCSHLAVEEFKDSLLQAAIKANVQLKQVVALGAAPDHPELVGVPETKYLAFYLFQVI